jgi:hypothetical protein
MRNDGLRTSLTGKGNLKTHSEDTLLDSLRAVLRTFEGDTDHDEESVADLKRILRTRIAELEAAEVSRRSTARSSTLTQGSKKGL